MELGTVFFENNYILLSIKTKMTVVSPILLNSFTYAVQDSVHFMKFKYSSGVINYLRSVLRNYFGKSGKIKI